MNPRVGGRVWVAAIESAGRRRQTGCGCGWFRRLVRLCFEVDLVAERFELALESAGAMFGRVTLALPVGAELTERDLVADDVVVGDEEVVTDRADRLGLTAASAQLGDSGRRGRCLWFARRLARTRSARRSASVARGGFVPNAGGRLIRDGPGTPRPTRRNARRSGTASCRARIRRSGPGRRESGRRGSCTAARPPAACGASTEADPLAEVLDRGVERVDVREQLRDHDAVVLDLKAAGERFA